MANRSTGLAARIEALSPRGLWWVAVLASAVVIVAVSGAAALALRRGEWWVGWQPVGLAMVVAATMPIVGLWLLGNCDPDDEKRISRAAYSGTPIRMFAAGLLAAVVLLSLGEKSHRVAFVLWLTGLYLVSLLAETVVLAVWLRGRSGVTRV
jgi:hypothetical protein